MNPEELFNIIIQSWINGIFTAIKMLFLTKPTCFIVYGMIIMAIGFNILYRITRKRK